MKWPVLFIFLSITLILSCSDSESSDTFLNNPNEPINPIDPVEETGNNGWLIPLSEVRDGGPGKDGIPSIDGPKFSTKDESSSFLTDDMLVIAIKVGDEVKAYPHFILDWHEIVNDNLDRLSLAITYCPLTGTAIGWNRKIDGVETTFGVSGLLYNNNLLPYDRLTGSNWSQIRLECVNGSLIGSKPTTFTLIEASWGTLKLMFPQAMVLNTSTGFSRSYGTYPYGDYRTNNSYLIFPLSTNDGRLPAKERVHAVINNEESKVYRFDSFNNGNVIRDVYKGKELLVVGDEEIIVSFELDNETNELVFTYVFNESEAYFNDNEGNLWNVFGEAISGPRKGQRLELTTSCMAYWFSIGAFYPGAEIFQ